MATIQDLPAPLQDRIRMDAAMLSRREDEHKAYILRCVALRRQPFVEGWADPVYSNERPVTGEERQAYHAHYEMGESHPLHATEVRYNAKYQQYKQLEAKSRSWKPTRNTTVRTKALC